MGRCVRSGNPISAPLSSPAELRSRVGGSGSRTWSVSIVEGGASELLGDSVPSDTRELRVCQVTRPSLVMGSTQPQSHLDSNAASQIEVVRRRSGGGAVLLMPGEAVWVEISVPHGDPLWEPDIGRAFWWLGELWAAVLASLGEGPLSLHRGKPVGGRWSSYCCFAGLGSGEITAKGHKVLGISQRRTRQGSLFQCALALRSRPSELIGLLALSESERPEALAALEQVAGSGQVIDRTAAEVQGALLEFFPATA